MHIGPQGGTELFQAQGCHVKGHRGMEQNTEELQSHRLLSDKIERKVKRGQWVLGDGAGSGPRIPLPLRVYSQWGNWTCADKVGKMEVSLVIRQKPPH